MSSVEIRDKGLEINFVTRNNRFTVVDFDTAGHTSREVIRESFFMDRQYGLEGPPNVTVTVEGMVGDTIKWRFQEPGERGDILTDNVYRVIKASIISHWRTDTKSVSNRQNVELSRTELETLDRAIASRQ